MKVKVPPLAAAVYKLVEELKVNTEQEEGLSWYLSSAGWLAAEKSSVKSGEYVVRLIFLLEAAAYQMRLAQGRGYEASSERSKIRSDQIKSGKPARNGPAGGLGLLAGGRPVWARPGQFLPGETRVDGLRGTDLDWDRLWSHALA